MKIEWQTSVVIVEQLGTIGLILNTIGSFLILLPETRFVEYFSRIPIAFNTYTNSKQALRSLSDKEITEDMAEFESLIKIIRRNFDPDQEIHSIRMYEDSNKIFLVPYHERSRIEIERYYIVKQWTEQYRDRLFLFFGALFLLSGFALQFLSNVL